MRNFRLGSLILAVFLLALPAPGYGQNEEMPVNEDLALIGLGIVSRVEPAQLVVTEYEYETDNEMEVIYAINEKTEFENLKGLVDLKLGDSVEVVYTADEGKRFAISVSKEEDAMEEEGMDNGAEGLQDDLVAEKAPVPSEVTNSLDVK